MERSELLENAYFAGLFDGEGHIGLTSRGGKRAHNFRPVMKVNMTDRPTIEALHKRFGGSISYRDPPSPRHKPQWAWRASNQIAGRAAEALLPFLRIKKAAAEHLLSVTKAAKRGRPMRTAHVYSS